MSTNASIGFSLRAILLYGHHRIKSYVLTATTTLPDVWLNCTRNNLRYGVPMNSYASFAATVVDVADVEHIVWANNGQLIHAIYDENSGTWDQARPISNAQGGFNLKLIAGDLYLYLQGGSIE